MWQDQMLNYSEQFARRFNNQRVFQTITVNNSEYRDPINYLPVRQYCQVRFIRHLEIIGQDRVTEIMWNRLSGSRDRFSVETKALALLTGLRETGLPLIGDRAPPPGRFFRMRGQRYIRNFGGSGLDYINSPHYLRGMRGLIVPGLLGRIIIDDPHSPDARDVGIDQMYLLTVFAAYLKFQESFYLNGNFQMINDRLIRLFWRSLTFAVQGGSNWERSRKGGLNSLKTLLEMLRIQPKDVPQVWDRQWINNRVNTIEDINLLKRLARDANSRLHPSDVNFWQTRAKDEIQEGLQAVNYFQSIKIAAITEAFISCDLFVIPPNPY